MSILYTDGSCDLIKGAGGWAVVDGSSLQILKTGAVIGSTVTNNRMELQAVIEAMGMVKDPITHIMTDSQYVCNGINTWMARWVKNNFKTAKGGVVKNQDLWIKLRTLLIELTNSGYSVEISWVKAHNGDVANDLADSACYEVMLNAINLKKLGETK